MAEHSIRDEQVVARFSKARKWGSTKAEMDLIEHLMPICNSSNIEKLKKVIYGINHRMDNLDSLNGAQARMVDQVIADVKSIGQTHAGATQQVTTDVRNLQLSQSMSDQHLNNLRQELATTRAAQEALAQDKIAIEKQTEALASFSKICESMLHTVQTNDALYRAKKESIENLEHRIQSLEAADVGMKKLSQYEAHMKHSEELENFWSSPDGQQILTNLASKLYNTVMPGKSDPVAKSTDADSSKRLRAEHTLGSSGAGNVLNSQHNTTQDGLRFLTQFKNYNVQFVKERPLHEYRFVRTFLERQTPRVARALQQGILDHCPLAREKISEKRYGKFKMRLILDRQALTWNNVRVAHEEIGFEVLARREAMDMKYFRARMKKQRERGESPREFSRQVSGAQDMRDRHDLHNEVQAFGRVDSTQWAGEGNSEF